MNLYERINAFVDLGIYLKANHADWQNCKQKASIENAWFTEEFIDIATQNIIDEFLQRHKLENWAAQYHIPEQTNAKLVGIVMAGNIPMVGFHDLLSVLVAGHRAKVKLSSKDDVLMKFIIQKLIMLQPKWENYISIDTMLKQCDAYITTGSNNSSRYFEYYFAKYPHIIRKNKTSVAILQGNETEEELKALCSDVCTYFGLGCRNVTKIFVPEGYDFKPLLNALQQYEDLILNHKYKHNYDYHLALLIMNSKYYMTNNTTILTENSSVFAPVSQLHYAYYEHLPHLQESLQNHPDIQCIVGKGFVPFGQAQQPTLTNYADGVDTMAFLTQL